MGENLRRIRATWELSQSDIAASARAMGLGWAQSSIAQIENGRRKLNTDELLALPFIVTAAIRSSSVSGSTGQVDYAVTLAELLAPPHSTMFGITDSFALSRGQVQKWLGADLPRTRSSRRARVGDADLNVARALNLSVPEVTARAERLWGRTITEERELRLRQAQVDTDRRGVQAVRGHITRALMTELAEASEE